MAGTCGRCCATKATRLPKPGSSAADLHSQQIPADSKTQSLQTHPGIDGTSMPIGAASIVLWLVIRCRVSVVAFGAPSAAQRHRLDAAHAVALALRMGADRRVGGPVNLGAVSLMGRPGRGESQIRDRARPEARLRRCAPRSTQSRPHDGFARWSVPEVRWSGVLCRVTALGPNTATGESAAGAGDEGGHDVGDLPVKGLAATVVALQAGDREHDASQYSASLADSRDRHPLCEPGRTRAAGGAVLAPTSRRR